MPKLNLNIFSQDDPKPQADHSDDTGDKGFVQITGSGDPSAVPPRAIEAALEDNNNRESPRFVPVGFYSEQLRLLDEAVLKLRQTGHWNASKSAIIRELIGMHRHELDHVWLTGRRR